MANVLHNSASLNQPISATLRGKQVRLIATGDVEGMSPSFLYIDESGKAEWASIQDFTINDPNVLPPSQETMQRVNREMAGSQR